MPDQTPVLAGFTGSPLEVQLRDLCADYRHPLATTTTKLEVVDKLVPLVEHLLTATQEPVRRESIRQRLMRRRPEDDAEFLQFWEMYGRTGPRKVAYEGWCRALASGADPQAILDGLEKWVRYWVTPGAARIKWPQGWLSERRWEDEPPVAVLAAQGPAHGTDQLLARMRAKAAQR
jgi:hypothetical protein